MKLRIASAFTFGSLLVLSLAAAACSPAGRQGYESTAGSGGSSTSSDGGSSSSMGNTGGDDIMVTGGTGGGGGGPGFEACATASEAASTLPLNMYIAIDRSGSMANDNKWGNAKAAFESFFQDPLNTDPEAKISVALRFWPDGQCSELTCSINACSQPEVALGPLSDPNQVNNLVSLYNTKSPNGNTPMWAALGGAAKWGVENAQLGEGGTATVIVFVTDGEPNGCDENINNIAQHAAAAYATAGVPTFAVGLAGSNESQMQTIATAGNTGAPFLIGNGNAQADLAAALKAIQTTTLACVFAMPEAQGLDPIDPELVNLTYTPSGAAEITIGKVDGAGQCDAAGGWGWFYDDPVKPNVIQLCPALCEKVQGDPDGKIQIVLGCETKPA
jgi:hypothetical protein